MRDESRPRADSSWVGPVDSLKATPMNRSIPLASSTGIRTLRSQLAMFVSIVSAIGVSLAAAQPIAVEGETPFYPEGKPLNGLIITVDPGHGGSPHQDGYHGSARGVKSRVVEGDINMLVAAELRHHLVGAGATVHMTRLDDRKVTYGATSRAEELGARAKLAADTRSHLFLSLHHNSTGRATADGVVVMIWPTDSKGKDQPLERAFGDILREEVEEQVHHTGKFPPYINDHPLVADNDIPAVTVEFGFLSNPEFDAWVARQGSHRAEAVGVYNGVVRMWKEHGKALRDKRAELFPETAGEVVKESAPPLLLGPAETRFARLAEQVNPGGRPPATPEEAQRVVDLYKKTGLSDSTFFYLETNITKDASGWTIGGRTNQPILAKAAGSLLEAAGCKPLKNEIETLPSARLGEKRFGVVQIPMAFTWAQPREGAGVQTQLLLGESVFLLDVSDDGTYLLLHGGDGYAGWVRREAIRELDKTEFAFWMNEPRASFARDVMIDDFRVPAGASLPVVMGAGGSGGYSANTLTLKLPKAVKGAKGSDEFAFPLDALTPPPATPSGRAAAEAAGAYLTVPYVFGGRSRIGIDCSGLTGNAYAAIGLTLPRDAFQQVIVGRLVGAPWYRDALQPGDLLFFIADTGRVIHAGVSLGGERFIHAAPPEVLVSSFDPADPLYSEAFAPAFCFARRPLP